MLYYNYLYIVYFLLVCGFWRLWVKRSRVVMVVIVFFVTTILLVLLLFSPFSRQTWKSLASTLSPSQNTDLSRTAIARENTQLGTKKWQYNLDKGTSIYIQAYADTVSLLPGQKISFSVSTHDEGTRYSIAFYRLGWYGGDGARLMLSTNFLPGHAQGYYDGVQRALINCHSCKVNTTSGLVEANWQPSYSLTVPANWVTGVYLAKFTDEYNYTAIVPFDVKGNTHARYVVVTPDTTYQAYNDWGGFSLFTANTNMVQHSVKVSFNRPYMAGQDISQLFDSELDAIRWLEMQGYDLSYVSAVDLHEHPRLLLDHQAYLSLGQDSFWTKEMRDGIESARDHGVGLAFLGAETGTWQMRFEPDFRGQGDRTMVSYRVSSASHNLQFDPFYGKDPSRVTTQWRDPLLARPENALLGVMFSGFTTRPTNFAWHTSSHVTSPLLTSTGLNLGKDYGCGLVGNVWDRVFDNGATPPGLAVLATSQTVNANAQPDGSNTTTYIAPSGAMVFAAGSLYWSRGLDAYRFHQDPQCPLQEEAVPEIQRLMLNIMNALVTPHRPAPLSQRVLPLITTPYAVNVPANSPQSGFVGMQNGSLPIRRQAEKHPAPSENAAPSSSGQNTISSGASTASTTKSNQTKRSHQSSSSETQGSFRAGHHGHAVRPAAALPSAFSQSQYYRAEQAYRSEIGYQPYRLPSIEHTRSWRYIVSRFLVSLRHNWLLQ